MIALAMQNAGIECEVVDSEGAVGGGAFPTARLRSAAIAIAGNAVDIETRLRHSADAVIGRIVDGRVLLDPRSVPEDRDEAFAAAIVNALTA